MSKKVFTRIATKKLVGADPKVSITSLCKQFGISRQAFYQRIEDQKEQQQQKQIIVQLIKNERLTLARLGGKKLYKLVKQQLDILGIKCGRDKFFDILREEDLLVKTKRKFVKTTQSYHRYRKHTNLVKDIELTQAEQVFVSDITYIKTQNGFLYLFLITDAYSKQIMGYELSDNMKVINAINALKQAIANRQYPDRVLIHHSDRGLQYCHPDYIQVLTDNDILVSMTSKYDPYENAVAERVNGILKTEFIIEGRLPNGQDAQKEVSNAVWLYNNKRPHFSCDLLTPFQAHRNEGFKLKKWPSKFSKNKQLSN